MLITILKYILVALVQGIGEILPISSSGHMVIVQTMLGMNAGDLTFEVFLHFASLIAIIAFFYKKIWLMIKSFFLYIFNKERRQDEETKHNFFLCIYLIIATIPAAIVGLLFDDIIETYLSKMWIVGIFLIFTSIMLFASTKMKKEKELKDMNWLDALVFGIAQCFGVIPGISRSGSCIVGGSTRKFNQSDAAEFAFIMAIPVMLGSAIVKVDDIATCFQDTSLIIPYIVAFLVTLISTYFALVFFLKIVRKQKLSVFSIYCLVVGTLAIVLGLTLYR